MRNLFENAEAQKSARVLTNQVASLRRREPLSKGFGLRNQIQRAAVWVMNNVAEGWEGTPAAEQRQACNYAPLSCGEVRPTACVLHGNKFVTLTEQQQLLARRVQIGKLIGSFIRSLDSRD
jgi:four helix bundle protein